MKPILEIQHLSKRYDIHKGQEPYLSLRDHWTQLFKPRTQTEAFWALKEVSFSVSPGESVGIIGKNGAGKSTLLKILSKITPPTSGRIVTRGRIASLLEVGTGFHPELTGRENIYLNGSILGLRKKEIDTHIEAIVDFSGVAQFIDTPLKRYSSGMQLRLAFSVAAHLEPEILIIDEVLAVGDAEFQKKCLGRMDEVSKSGRTVLFVSHDLQAVTKLCAKSIVLHKGQLEFYDNSYKAAEFYHNLSKTDALQNSFTGHQNTVFFRHITVLNPMINAGNDLEIALEIHEPYVHKSAVININITDPMGNLIAHIVNYDDAVYHVAKQELLVSIKNINLPIGRYFLSFWSGHDFSSCIEYIPEILTFEILSIGDFLKRSSNIPPQARIVLQSEWKS